MMVSHIPLNRYLSKEYILPCVVTYYNYRYKTEKVLL